VQIVCKDGTSLTVEQRRGACSGHGGIDKAAPKDVSQPAGADKVWVNQSTKVYHCSGDVYYGKTKKGAYMSEPEAKSKGFRPDHGKTCAA
jgi:sulfatase maturation enzyme AslB (radical SAM superfamily)